MPVRCVRDVYVWECLGLVVCFAGGCVGPSECQVCRECVCRSVSGADVSVSVSVCAGCVYRNVGSVVRARAVAECVPGAARGGGGRMCVYVCVFPACVRVWRAGPEQVVARVSPAPPRSGRAGGSGGRNGGPAAADSDMSGRLLFRKFRAALLGG